MRWEPWLALLLALLAFSLAVFGFATMITLMGYFFEWLWSIGRVGS